MEFSQEKRSGPQGCGGGGAYSVFLHRYSGIIPVSLEDANENFALPGKGCLRVRNDGPVHAENVINLFAR